MSSVCLTISLYRILILLQTEILGVSQTQQRLTAIMQSVSFATLSFGWFFL
nr:MAG TPA: hypothetical protein [Caudoviricetes sp.]